MHPGRWPREPFPLLVGAIATALLALGAARVGAGLAADRAQAAPVLALLVRSTLWMALAWAGIERAGLRPPALRRAWALAVGVGLATGALSALALALAAGRLPVAAPLLPDPAGLDPAWFAALALGALLLAPAAEEVLFRGALLDGLRRRHGDGVALAGSAAAFALLHLHPVHLVTAFLSGLLLGWLRLRTGRVWPCVLAHAVHNALWLGGGLP